MKSVTSISIFLIVLSSLLFAPLASAQEFKVEGECLDESSWVFTEAEFDTLLVTLQTSAEADSINAEIIALQDSLILEYKELDENENLGFWRWPTISEWVLMALATLGWVSN